MVTSLTLSPCICLMWTTKLGRVVCGQVTSNHLPITSVGSHPSKAGWPLQCRCDSKTQWNKQKKQMLVRIDKCLRRNIASMLGNYLSNTTGQSFDSLYKLSYKWSSNDLRKVNKVLLDQQSTFQNDIKFNKVYNHFGWGKKKRRDVVRIEVI